MNSRPKFETFNLQVGASGAHPTNDLSKIATPVLCQGNVHSSRVYGHGEIMVVKVAPGSALWRIYGFSSSLDIAG